MLRNDHRKPLRTASAILLTTLSVGVSPTGATESDPLEIATTYIQSHHQSLGLNGLDLTDMVVKDHYVTRHNGVTHIYLQQRFEGIDVKNAILTLTIAPDGNVVHVGQRFVPHLALRAKGTADLSALEALDLAASELGLPAPTGVETLKPAEGRDRKMLLSKAGISLDDIPARLVYQPVADGRLQLAWDLVINELDQSNWWNVRIDAESGRILAKSDYVARGHSDFQERYQVYPMPVESPEHASNQPPYEGRNVVEDPFRNSAASPYGWHDIDGQYGAEYTITRGNNVHAYADTDAGDNPDGGDNAEPDGGNPRDFTFEAVPLDFDDEPDKYTQASIVNLFYWNNIIHDVLWEYGFDERAGNFQVNNYSGHGRGNDEVLAETQDGLDNCNATFATPEDGQSPRMQMFNCRNSTPSRDASFDSGVVVHEYGHGLSNRLTGGPGAVTCLNNDEQMGEGWSDFLALMFTMDQDDSGSDPRGIANYLFDLGTEGPGIREAPYSTDRNINDFTYGDIARDRLTIPYGVGFVWATMLWDMTWNLIDKHGFNPNIYDPGYGGNNLALQLVIDGMKMQPCSPGFVDARDAILAADDMLTGDGGFFTGQNQCTIWQAFARRGLGVEADQGDPNNAADGTENLDMPPSCEELGAPISQQNICQGDRAHFRIGVGEGFTDPPVTLAAQGLPGRVIAEFNPPTVYETPEISNLTISNTDGVPVGSHIVPVVGTDNGGNIFATRVQLDVFNAAPTTSPELLLPADGLVGQPIRPTFNWKAVPSATTYSLEISRDSTFATLDYTLSGIQGVTHRLEVGLAYAQRYYWRVKGDNPCGSADYSTARSFTTLPEEATCAGGVTPSVHFMHNFETDMGWTRTGDEVHRWTVSNTRSNSPKRSIRALLPPTQSDQRLVSPSIFLPSVPQLTLQFASYQVFETFHSDGRCRDAAILEIKVGDGPWSQVPQSALLTTPYDNIIWDDIPGSNPIAEDYGATDAWCPLLQPFEVTVVDLSDWTDNDVRFRWRLGSDPAAGHEGWYIDDVKVQSCNTPPRVRISYPTDRGTFPKEGPIPFGASATDAQDGTINSDITWTARSESNTINLEMGGCFFDDQLDVGTYTIEATVTDSGGLVHTDNVQIEVTDQTPDAAIYTSDLGQNPDGPPLMEASLSILERCPMTYGLFNTAAGSVIIDTLPDEVEFQLTYGCEEDPYGVPVCTVSPGRNSYSIHVCVESTLRSIENCARRSGTTNDVCLTIDPPGLIFDDDFETGNTSAWTRTKP